MPADAWLSYSGTGPCQVERCPCEVEERRIDLFSLSLSLSLSFSSREWLDLFSSRLERLDVDDRFSSLRLGGISLSSRSMCFSLASISSSASSSLLCKSAFSRFSKRFSLLLSAKAVLSFALAASSCLVFSLAASSASCTAPRICLWSLTCS